jgi:probable O-glycosylation ligase (exosortase A-associated)
MRDLIFVAFLLAMWGFGFRKPFMFVLAYAYIDIVAPQRLTYMLLNTVPIAMITVGLAVLGWLFADDKRDTRFAPRQALIVLLIIYCWVTTTVADFPVEAADKWSWVWKSLAFAAFLPLTLRTKLRIESMMLFVILSCATIIIVGGIKTVASGGGYGELNLMVSNNVGLYESSIISTAAICIVPIILFLRKNLTVFPKDWKVNLFAWALVFACLLIPVGTSARTGLICIAVLGVLALRSVKHRFRYIMLVAVAAAAAVPFLPTEFTDRMETIKGYKGDQSASTRIAVWQWTLDYAADHPFGGGFDAYRSNKIRFETVTNEAAGSTTEVQATVMEDKARAYHSAYFEVLGEQGYPGLAIWLLIHGIGMIRMEVLRRRYKSQPNVEGQWIGSAAEALQHAHIVYMVGSIFVGIAFQPFVFYIVGLQIGLDTYAARRTKEANWTPFKANKPAWTAAA